MTQFTDEALEQFRQIYERVFDKEISLDEARDMGLRVVLLYESLAMPLPRRSGGWLPHEAEDGSEPEPPPPSPSPGSP